MPPHPILVLLPRKALYIPKPEPSQRDKALIGKALIGKYKLRAIIGSGGMGTVFRAEHIQLGRDFAVKVLSESLSENPANVLFFHEEARKLAQVHHNNIVSVSDVDTDSDTGIHFFVMELLEGRPLDQVITDDGPRPIHKVVPVIQQIASALSFAHEKGLIHRDVKPANVFITTDGRAVLTDFGIAVHSQEANKLRGTAGTVAYMSPEQREGKSVDYKTDIYSLGVVCYEMLSGTNYFLSSRSGINPFQRLPAPQLGDIIQRALADSPEDRYRSAIDLANELQRFTKSTERRRSIRKQVSLALRVGVGLLVTVWLVITISNSIMASIWPSPDSAIVFTVAEASGSENVWVMNPDGRGKRQLTFDKVRNIKPVWDPDHKLVAFTSVANNGIFIKYLEYHSGKPGILLSNCDDIDYGKNGQIAVSRWNDSGNKWDVAIAVGDSLATIVSTENDDFRPNWSPDGTKLAYLSETEGVVQIFLVDVTKEGSQQQLTFDGANFDPAWSPDGKLIAFSSYRTGESEIYVMQADGSDQGVLFTHNGDDLMPSWSPRGDKMVFASNANGNMDVWTINIDGTGLVQLTNSPLDESMPYWGQ